MKIAFKFCIATAFCVVAGCQSAPGARTSIWPTQKLDTEGSAGSSGLAGFASRTKGQLSTVGSAFSSAYEKTKTAITTPFVAPAANAENAATSSTAKVSSISPEVYLMTGQLNESTGDYKKALDNYSKAMEIEPKNVSAMLATARLYDRQNDREKAISFYQKAAELSPNAATFVELGNLQAKAGNLTAAKEELQKAVNLDPKTPSHRTSLAGVLLDQGKAEAAIDELSQVNSPAMANYQMAYLNFTRKNIPATQQYLTNALTIDPNLKPARDLMASLGGSQSVQQLAQQGNDLMGKAQSTLQQASAIGQSVQGYLPTAGAPMPIIAVPMNNYAPTATNNAYSLPQPSASVTR
jgi:tetratricopeptide (TPR) repeat protein